MSIKSKIIFVQFGSPVSPAIQDVRDFLKRLLSDPKLIGVNPTLWKIIFNLFILPFRPRKSALAYKRIWTDDGFPLVIETEKLVKKVSADFARELKVEMETAYLFSPPYLMDLLKNWEAQGLEDRATKWLIFPLFPQFSSITTGIVQEQIASFKRKPVAIEMTVVEHFCDGQFFVDCSANLIDSFLEEIIDVDELVISFHGMPLRLLKDKNDPYLDHCQRSFSAISKKVTKIDSAHISMSFQSRFDSRKWSSPQTCKHILQMVKKKKGKRVAVYSASFVADCLENIDEIGYQLKREVESLGGQLFLIPSLNARDAWCKGIGSFLQEQLLLG